tara:strand:- start:10750 stop:10893 length:144 start_codon:yes stop_codon:yes gene_type:complete
MDRELDLISFFINNQQKCSFFDINKLNEIINIFNEEPDFKSLTLGKI